MMWFSAVYADPAKVELPLVSHPTTLHAILRNARRQTFGDGQDQHAWSTSQLISACRDQGLKVHGHEVTEDFWVAGKQSIGSRGLVPLWERTEPPRLKMLEQIKQKSLEELEDLMGGFSRDAADDNIKDAISRASGDEIGTSAAGDGDRHSESRSAGTGKSIFAVSDGDGLMPEFGIASTTSRMPFPGPAVTRSAPVRRATMNAILGLALARVSMLILDLDGDGLMTEVGRPS